MCLWSIGVDWRIALVGCLVSHLCLLPLAAIFIARLIGNALRRADQNRGQR